MLQPNDEFLFTRQRHEADVMGLHYDLRLVHGDKAYSFATLKDMPKPGEIIAVYEQPVHDRAYALSEKVIIPKGQYGAGVTTLDWVRKAVVAPHSTPERLTIFTKDGEKFLLKKSPTKENDKSWIFRNITGMGTSQNPYLQKVEEMKKEASEASDRAQGAGEVAVGAKLMSKAPQRLLGYHTVYHGTNADTAAKIKEHGFDPKMGGTGAAKIDPTMVDDSAGKIHVTKSKTYARMYSSNVLPNIIGRVTGTTKNPIFGGVGKGEVLKARVSHDDWKGFKHDIVGGPTKRWAATTDKAIGSEHIAGGKGAHGRSPFMNKEHLAKYYGSSEGRGRGLMGVAMGLGGAALAMHGAKKALEKKSNKYLDKVKDNEHWESKRNKD